MAGVKIGAGKQAPIPHAEIGNTSRDRVPRKRRTMGKSIATWPAGVLLSLLVISAAGISRDEATVEQLKARVSSANVSDRVSICMRIAEKQLTETDRLYAAGELEQAQPALTDVVAFSELARDYSIQSHKHQKQTEISVRAITRKLNDLLHTLGHEEQAPVRDAVSRLERVRDDLLISMFPKGAK